MERNLSVCLFVLSALSLIMATSFLAERTKKLLLLNSEYRHTLQRLFQVVKLVKTSDGPGGGGGRHSLTSENLFGVRKRYFLDLFKKKCPALASAKIVHVAGTKGKGSTVEYVAAAIRQSGKRVGVFTSPHLHTARERLKFGRSLISKEDLVRFGKQALDELSNAPWAVFFDLFLHMAINYFNEQKAEYIVLEAGIGGRFDSTNFLDRVDVGVITSISLDHQALLGDTVEEIAFQKAGIMKPGSHIFTPSTQVPSVLRVLQQQAEAQQATLHIVPVNRNWLTSRVPLVVPFDSQVENACLAGHVLEQLGIPLGGMSDHFWPCRMETFHVNGVEVVVDGCHNGYSVRQFLLGLRKNLDQRRGREQQNLAKKSSRIVVIFGVGAEKSVKDMVNEVFELGDEVLLVQSKHFRALTEQELRAVVGEKEVWRRKLLIQGNVPGLGDDDRMKQSEPWCSRRTQGTACQRAVHLFESLRSEYSARPSDSRETTVVAVCGSLFVAAEIREAIYRIHPEQFKPNDWVRDADDL